MPADCPKGIIVDEYLGNNAREAFNFNDYESPIKKTTFTPQNNQTKSTNLLGPKNLFGDDN